jgi:hypothetical protein
LRFEICAQGSRSRSDLGGAFPAELGADLPDGDREVHQPLKGEGTQHLQVLRAQQVKQLGEEFDGARCMPRFRGGDAEPRFHDHLRYCEAWLAGARGRPACVALKQVPHWRWRCDRTGSPWYPGLRLYRQPLRGDWQGVFGALRAELLRLRQQARPADAAGPHGAQRLCGARLAGAPRARPQARVHVKSGASEGARRSPNHASTPARGNVSGSVTQASSFA